MLKAAIASLAFVLSGVAALPAALQPEDPLRALSSDAGDPLQPEHHHPIHSLAETEKSAKSAKSAPKAAPKYKSAAKAAANQAVAVAAKARSAADKLAAHTGGDVYAEMDVDDLEAYECAECDADVARLSAAHSHDDDGGGDDEHARERSMLDHLRAGMHNENDASADDPLLFRHRFQHHDAASDDLTYYQYEARRHAHVVVLEAHHVQACTFEQLSERPSPSARKSNGAGDAPPPPILKAVTLTLRHDSEQRRRLTQGAVLITKKFECLHQGRADQKTHLQEVRSLLFARPRRAAAATTLPSP